MPARRFFLVSPLEGTHATLSGDEAHHLAHVLRAEIGQPVQIMDGSGKVWEGEIAEIGHDTVEIQNLVPLPEESSPSGSIILVQSLCKADKLEWILQKTTELGVTEIWLLNATRSVVKIPKERMPSKLERWNKIILGAVKQSQRTTLPQLHPPTDCSALCQSLQSDLKLMFSESEKGVQLKNLLRASNWRSVAFCIGPEGGWTPQEENTFALHQFKSVSLGCYFLRAETAAIVATGILKYELEL